MTSYRVCVERDPEGWIARMNGLLGPAGVLARELSEVEPRCLRLIAEMHGVTEGDVGLDMEVRLPGVTKARLERITGLCAEITRERNTALLELTELGITGLDSAWLLDAAYIPPRPLIVTNGELAADGLSAHPDAVGVSWADHGMFETVKCRRHLEATRGEYAALAPEERNALIYDVEQLSCHLCE